MAVFKSQSGACIGTGASTVQELRLSSYPQRRARLFEWGIRIVRAVCCLWLFFCICLSGWAGDNAACQNQVALLAACRDGDDRNVRVLLDKNQALARQLLASEGQGQGLSPLGVAVSGGYAEIVRLLIDAGADVNGRFGAQERTPLMQICAQNCSGSAALPTDQVKALSLSEQLSTTHSEPSQIATAACRCDYLHCLRLLLNSGADLDVHDNQGLCALYLCAERGHREVLALLLRHGARVSGWTCGEKDPLCVAAFDGYLGCVRALLAAGSPVVTGRQYGFSALHYAAQRGHVEIFRALLQQGGSVNAESTPAGGTPLLGAAITGQLACTKALLDIGADINHADANGHTALYCAVSKDRLEVVRLLLSRGVKVAGWNCSSCDPLCEAAFKGHLGCVRALLAAGSPVVTGRQYGFSALHYAAQKGHVEIFRALLQQGGSVNAESTPAGGTPLLGAAITGQLACTQALLDIGADINHADLNGHTALYCAASKGRLEVVRLLLSRGVKVEGWNRSSCDPLCVAAFNGHLGCVRALLTAGSPMIIGRRHGFSAVNGAAQNGHVEILEYFLQLGFSANAESTPAGGTPLLVAAIEGQLSCIKALLAAGADVNRANDNSRTALHFAAVHQQPDAVALLLAGGARVDLRDREGKTALWSACERGHECVVAGLLAAGANPRMAVGAVTPLARAAQCGHPRVVAQLLAVGINPLHNSDLSLCLVLPRAEVRVQALGGQPVKDEDEEHYGAIEVTRLFQ